MPNEKPARIYLGLIALGFLVCVVLPALFLFSPVCRPVDNQSSIEFAHQPNPEQTSARAADNSASGRDQINSGTTKQPHPKYIEPFIGYWYCDVRPGDMALAFFTYCLVVVGWWGISSSEKTAGRQQILADRQHILTHRPHLVVRNVRAIEADPGNPIKIEFEVINIGTSDAFIIASSFEIRSLAPIGTYDNKPPPIVGDPPRNFLGASRLTVNAVWREFPYESGTRWTEDDFHGYVSPRQGIFFGGKILYQDGNGENRRLGVFRRLDTATRRFLPLTAQDADYEYDD